VIAGSWQGSIDAELVVVGRGQTAQIRYLDSPLQIWGASGTLAPDTHLWPEQQSRVEGALRSELADFVSCVRRGQASRVANLEQAVQGLQLAEAIVESAQLGRPVHLS
jgi:predicted dehydrogenase